MNERKVFCEWLERVDEPYLKAELEKIKGDDEEILSRFCRGLSFGTGGQRGVMGAGTNRINIYTIGRTSYGLADYLLKNKKGERVSVVIAYDSRNLSYSLALTVAKIMAQKGIEASIFKEIAPTPTLSFAVRYLGADAGIVITASHNPKQYNGFKVYNGNGCQITDETANAITKEIEKYGYFTCPTPEKASVKWLGEEIKDAFLSSVERYGNGKACDDICVVYTPLNGAGRKYAQEILLRKGVKRLFTVKEQEMPDGEFPTCARPNPEEEDATALALVYAKKVDADVVLATDPDADRVGVLVKHEGKFVRLNGNETGVILLDYLLKQRSENKTLGNNPCAIKTIVTTDMAKPIMEKWGGEVKEVLTGFKYIGEEMDQTDNFLLGFEESYGYLIGDHARDKDAISAVSLIVEAVSHYKKQGKTLASVLSALYEEFGYFNSRLLGFAFDGVDGMDKMKKLLSEIRVSPWQTVLGENAVMLDYLKGLDGLPKSDVLQFVSPSLKVTVRPSGTEPKLKAYFEVKGENKSDATAKMDALVAQTVSRLNLK